MKRHVVFLGLLICGQAFATSYDEPKQISKFLAPFKTYTGDKLPTLLKKYGLMVEFVDSFPITTLDPSVRRKGDQSNDAVINMKISGRAKPMPCGLHIWMAQGIPDGRAEHLSEVVLRSGKFVIDDEMDPVLYWAATGKCSTAYSLPV